MHAYLFHFVTSVCSCSRFTIVHKHTRGHTLNLRHVHYTPIIISTRCYGYRLSIMSYQLRLRTALVSKVRIVVAIHQATCDPAIRGTALSSRFIQVSTTTESCLYCANHGISFMRYLCRTYSKRAVLFIKTYENLNKVVRRSWRC